MQGKFFGAGGVVVAPGEDLVYGRVRELKFTQELCHIRRLVAEFLHHRNGHFAFFPAGHGRVLAVFIRQAGKFIRLKRGGFQQPQVVFADHIRRTPIITDDRPALPGLAGKGGLQVRARTWRKQFIVVFKPKRGVEVVDDDLAAPARRPAIDAAHIGVGNFSEYLGMRLEVGDGFQAGVLFHDIGRHP